MAEGRVRIGLFVEGEIVVIVLGEAEDVVSPFAGMVEVLSCVIVEVSGLGSLGTNRLP